MAFLPCTCINFVSISAFKVVQDYGLKGLLSGLFYRAPA